MAASIRLRTGQYRKYAAMKGWITDRAAADAIGVTPSTLSRVLRGATDSRGTAPGEQFIAGLLAAFPELDFSDLFEVYEATTEPVAS